MRVAGQVEKGSVDVEVWNQEKGAATWQADCAWIKELLENTRAMKDGRTQADGAAILLATVEAGGWLQPTHKELDWGIMDALSSIASAGIDKRPADFPQIERRFFLHAMFALAYVAGQQNALRE